MRHRWTALVLLLVGALASFGWQFYPLDAETIALVMYATQSLFQALLLGLLMNAYRSWAMWIACGMFAAMNLLFVGCSVAYLIAPWPENPEDEMCSAGLNLPIGVGVSVLICWAVLTITGETKRGR